MEYCSRHGTRKTSTQMRRVTASLHLCVSTLSSCDHIMSHLSPSPTPPQVANHAYGIKLSPAFGDLAIDIEALLAI